MKRVCYWAIEDKGSVSIISLKEGEKGYKLVNTDKRHDLKFIQFILYKRNQQDFGLMTHEVDQIVDFAFNDKPYEEVCPIQTPKGKKEPNMANTSVVMRLDLEKRNIFRGFRCGQKKNPHNYFEKKGSKFVDLKVSSKERVYEIKKWKMPVVEK